VDIPLKSGRLKKSEGEEGRKEGKKEGRNEGRKVRT
jgi:hypothetical protein